MPSTNSTQAVRCGSPRFFALVALRAYYTNAKNFAWLRTLADICPPIHNQLTMKSNQNKILIAIAIIVLIICAIAPWLPIDDKDILQIITTQKHYNNDTDPGGFLRTEIVPFGRIMRNGNTHKIEGILTFWGQVF